MQTSRPVPSFYVLEPLLKTNPDFNMTAESRYDEKAYDARMKELCDSANCALRPPCLLVVPACLLLFWCLV